MRILLYGDVDAHASGAWCYADALRQLGHELETFDDSELLAPYRRHFLLKAFRHYTSRVLPVHRRRIVASLLDRVSNFRPDIIIVIKGLHVGSEDVRRLKAGGAWVIVINHDDYFSGIRHNRNGLQLRAVRAYDHVFVTRRVNVDELRPLNPRVTFIPFAYHPDVHRPPPEMSDAERARWASDVLFVGTWEPDRCRLLEQLVQKVPADYVIYGSHWHHAGAGSPVLPFWKRRTLGADDMARAIRCAKVTLGFLRKANRDTHTQRTFEIPACGGVLLAERTTEHLEMLRPHVDAEFFDPHDPEELVAQVTRLLGDAPLRESLRENGHRAVTQGRHTYADRLRLILSLYPAPAAVPPRP